MIEVKYKDGNKKISAPLKGEDAWLEATPEEVVRQTYIAHLVNELGYELNQMAQELKVTNSQRGTGRASADIVIWKTAEDKDNDKHAAIVVECKSDNVTIQPADYYQGLNYATWVSADFLVTHNSKETRCFQVFKDKIPKHLGKELSRIPKAAELLDEDKKAKLFQDEKVFEKDEFAKLLHQCHNVIRNNDKLSPEAAFDEISKVLFMKIRYERNPDEDNIFKSTHFIKKEAHYEKNDRPVNIKLHGKNADIPYLDYWFELTKSEFEKDDLFSNNDRIRIRRESFLAIVKKLEAYNLSKTSDDVKGIAFEKFLGTTFRGELGQFFTPRTIVEFMTEILDPQEGERICDPCSGSGGFLINAFEYVREQIREDIEQQKEQIKAEYFDEAYLKAKDKEKTAAEQIVDGLFKQLNEELNLNNPKSRLYHLSHQCIYGTDANPRMARVSKMNMIMHGDGHGGVHHNDGLLDINGIFEERFDVILTNPPFGSRVDKSLKITQEDNLKTKPHYQDWLKQYGASYSKIGDLREAEIKAQKKLVDKYEVGNISTLTEIMFMERCIKLLRKGGRMGIVLPEGVLNTSNLQKARDYFEGRAKLILITSIPQDVFVASGATVKPSLVFLKRFTQAEETEWKNISQKATLEVQTKYEPEVRAIEDQLKLKGSVAPSKDEKKELRAELKALDAKIAAEIRAIVKERFNYTVPLAEVAQAGIDSKGAKITNELPTLKDEYAQYRRKAKLWTNETAHEISYKVENKELWRVSKDPKGELKEGVFYAE